MLPLYEKIEQLCRSRNINVTQMCREAGVARAVLSDYKCGRKKTIGVQNLSKMAAYFNVSVDYLIGTEDAQKEKAPVLTEKDKRDIARDLERMRADLENSDTLMFEGNPMSPEARESILAAVNLGLEAAKIQNKQKYTPKKYKKE